MSFNPNPGLYDEEPPPWECPVCFGANQTNHSVFICIQGMEFGTGIPGVDPDPPNGVFEVNPTAACLFSSVIGNYTFEWRPSPAPSSLIVWSPHPTVAFFENPAGACRILFLNSLVNPAADPYINGRAVVVPSLDCNLDNIQQLLDLIPWDPTIESFANPRPLSAAESTFTLTRRQDHSNLRVKFDHT